MGLSQKTAYLTIGKKEKKMDNITKYLNKVAYKFPKGYPDMNNAQDVLLLEILMSELLGEKFSLEEGAADVKVRGRN